MKALSKNAQAPWLWLCFSVLVSFALYGHYVHYDWLRVQYPDDLQFLARGPITWKMVGEQIAPQDGGFWRPTFFLYFAAMVRFFGDNPAPFHAVAVAFHGLVIGTFALLVRRVTQSTKTALLAAALFVVWPVQYEEAIWWVSSTCSLFVSFWFLVTLHAWLSWRQTRQARYFVGALVAMALAFGSKEDVVPLPFVWLAFDLLLLVPRALLRRAFVEWLPMAALTAGYVVIEVLSYGQAQKTYSQDVAGESGHFARSLAKSGLTLRFADTLTLDYLQLYPASLTTVFGLAVVWALWKLGKSRPDALLRLEWAFVWFALFCPLFPLTMGLNGFGSRYRYVPALAVSMMVACIVARLWRNRSEGRLALAALAGLLAARFVPLPSDPLVVWFALLGVLGGVAFVARERWFSWRTGAAFALVVAMPQAELYTQTFHHVVWIGASALLCTWLLQDWRRAVVLTWAAFLSPLVALPVVLFVEAWGASREPKDFPQFDESLDEIHAQNQKVLSSI